MSNLFGGGKPVAQQPKRATGLQLQTSQYGPPIPVLYGRNRISGNVIWYGDFQATKHTQNVGKGGSASSSSYTYSASYMIGVCEGPILDIKTNYEGSHAWAPSAPYSTIKLGSEGQSAWSHLTGTAAIGYSGTALFCRPNWQLGSTPTLPNHNFEVDGLQQYDNAGGKYDADPKDILTDICTNTKHGVGFNYLGTLTQFSNYCVASNLLLSPYFNTQQAARQSLENLFKWTNSAPYFSEGVLKVVPLGDQAVTGNGVTFTPDTTPVFALTDDDFLAGPNESPIKIDRKSPTDSYNLVRLEFNDASQQYNTSTVIASIDDDVIANGSRSQSSIQVKACTNGTTARVIAQNMLQRQFYVRNTYTFRLPWKYCTLEPTDIVTLTEASVGLDTYPVRITEVEEDNFGTLTITAEEFPEGVGNSASYAYQNPAGTLIDTYVDPGAVNAPFFFRGPGFLVNGSNPEIWCAVNGSGQYWSGHEMYISYDGTSYQYLGTYFGGATYGELTTTLPSGTDPDSTNTPTVVLNAPETILGATTTEADNFATLSIVDSELISYSGATLTAPETYQLSYLRRGAYGSAIASHAVNAPFARLNDEIIRIPVDPSLIGTTIYVKFLSLNSFGNTSRTLADETAYTYTVGDNVELPDVPAVPGSPSATSVADGVSISWTNTNPAAIGATSIEYATASTGPWTVLDQVGRTQSSYIHHFTNGATYYYRLRARGFLVQSGWSAYTSTITNAGKTVADGADVTGKNIAYDTQRVSGADALAVQLAATQSLDKITKIADDGVLSAAEKPRLIRDVNDILNEQNGIDTQATDYGLSTEKTAYDTAVTNLTDYLSTLTTPVAWNNTSGDTDLT